MDVRSGCSLHTPGGLAEYNRSYGCSGLIHDAAISPASATTRDDCLKRDGARADADVFTRADAPRAWAHILTQDMCINYLMYLLPFP